MYLIYLKIKFCLFQYFKSRFNSTEQELVHNFRCWPGDLDQNIHMNNGRFLIYMEICRWDMMIRSHFLKYGLKNKMMAPITNEHIVYKKPLAPFQKFTIRTKISHIEESAFYIQHIVESKGKVCTIGLFKSIIIQDGKKASAIDTLNAVGIKHAQNTLPTIVTEKDTELTRELIRFTKGNN